MDRATILVRGRVQGVGFRYWTRARALELGLVGYARNLERGWVEVCAQGEGAAIERLEQLLSERPSSAGRPGRVEGCATQWGSARPGLRGFVEC